MLNEFWDLFNQDIRQTHVIINAEAGHGKTMFVKSLVKGLQERDPRIIIKVFDVSYAWFDDAPLPHRQRVTPENWANAYNQDNCIYEMGDLNEDTRRLFVSIIIKQDYTVRRKIRELYGEDGLKRMPFTIYVFEESDTYFDSQSLNKKDEASATLRDFIKVGRNFSLRGLCIVTANTGELGTKLRRRSKHLIGRIISEEDLREYNHKRKGLGDAALSLERYHWLYYNGRKQVGPFKLDYVKFKSPKESVKEVKSPADIRIELKEGGGPAPKDSTPWFFKVMGYGLIGLLLLFWLLGWT